MLSENPSQQGYYQPFPHLKKQFLSIECVNTVFKYCFEDDTYMSFIIENLTYHTKQGKSVFAAGKYCCRKIIISTKMYVPWTHLLSLPLWMIIYRQQCIEKLEITYRFNMRIQYHSITSWN